MRWGLHNYQIEVWKKLATFVSSFFGILFKNYKFIELNARLTAVAFYEKLGFAISAAALKSNSTSIVHLPMRHVNNI